jgi:hypothetical protein
MKSFFLGTFLMGKALTGRILQHFCVLATVCGRDDVSELNTVQALINQRIGHGMKFMIHETTNSNEADPLRVS